MPAKLEEFRRGWPILLGAILGTAFGVSSLPLYTSGVFFTHLEADFGWSRTQLSGGIFMFTLALAVASPFVGSLVDRAGLKGPILVSLAALVAGFGLLGTALNSLPTYYLLLGGMAVLGAASSPLTFTRIVNGWFNRARGLALGITLMGPGLAAASAPALVTWLIESFGWRAGYLGIACAILVAAPVILWLVRSHPKQNSVAGAPQRAPIEVSASAAFRGRIFWVLLAGLFLLSLCLGGLVVHLVPLLVDSGMSPIEAAATAGVLGVSVIAGRLGAGALVDHFFAPYVMISMILLSAAGCLLLASIGPAAAIPATAAIGLALGAEVDVIGYLVARYFGLETYGRIYGWQYGAFILGGGMSPLWIGMSYDASGAYQIALWTTVALQLVACVLFASLPRFSAAPLPRPLQSQA